VFGRRRDSAPVDVLAVCTGNLCRSPMVETLLRAAAPGLVVRSAGTAAPLLRPWHPLTVQVLHEAGHDVSGRAQRLRRADVAAARLVLTAEGMHRALAIHLEPDAEDRTFTLLEAVRLLRAAPLPAALGPERLAAHLAAVRRENPAEYDDDLADPILGDLEQFRTCLRAVDEALGVIVPVLTERPAG
jgi:protein-tyrosine phosphatase